LSPKTNKNLEIKKIQAFFFDFDGVLTNNKVILNEDGTESVVCDRSDGLGFKYLSNINKNIYIISTEKNKVVSTRAKKLNVKCYQGIIDKLDFLKKLCKKKKINLNKSVYVGNDLNDYEAMKDCKIRICPKDSHKEIISIANYVLKKNGGEGVVVEIIEKVFNEKILKKLY
tara:strand:- start:78 stop:590 length:513 start_codon:yes stop_codon:yes gene_type:complete